MDTYDNICMWCSRAIMMGKEEYEVFKGVLLSKIYTEQEEKLIQNAIEFIDKIRDP